jgi:hypothetical protein
VSAIAAHPGAAAQSGASQQTGTLPQATEGCPLCGTPLQAEQEWCLRCGAAARTRLASTPNWRAPLIVLGLAIALGLGALTASLVTLAGGPKTTPVSTITRTVTAGASGTSIPGTLTPGTSVPGATAPATTTPGSTAPGTTGSTTPGATATTPGATATTPGAAATTPGAATTGTTAPGAVTPGATTTGAASKGGSTTGAAGKGATIPGTRIRIPGASAGEASKILNLLAPHATH